MGRPFFLHGQAEGVVIGTPDRRHTRGRGEGVLQYRPACDPGCAAMSARQGVEMRFEHGASTVTLDARTLNPIDLCFAPPLLQQLCTHDPLTRYFARDIALAVHLGESLSSNARSRKSGSNMRASVLLHRCTAGVPRSVQRVQGLSEKRFSSSAWRWKLGTGWIIGGFRAERCPPTGQRRLGILRGRR